MVDSRRSVINVTPLLPLSPGAGHGLAAAFRSKTRETDTMGGNSSAARTVSFGLDEDEKVTVIEGVKVHARMSRVESLCLT